MSAQQHLLLIGDPDHLHSLGLARAIALALATHATLHVLICGGPPGSLRLLREETLEQIQEEFLERQQASLEELRENLLARGLQMTFEIVWADKIESETIRLLQNRQADLVIKATQHEPLLKRAFITPLDWQLLRNCPLPLHLVSTAEHPLPRKVAAAVDLSRSDAEGTVLNEHIAAMAQNFAQHCGAQLHLVMAYEDLPSFFAYAASPVSWTDALRDELASNLRGTFHQFAERWAVPEHRRHLLPGKPAKVIPEFVVHSEIDVVVMGTLTNRGAGKVLGSTAEQLLYKVPAIIAIHPTAV